MATERLYLIDPLLLDFDGAVAAVSTWKGTPSVLLDRSAFYPEGGGQLGDQGWIHVGDERLDVKDVQVDEEGLVHHILGAPLSSIAVGARCQGYVEETRRRDHMAQHTGQHLLSRALLDAAGAETVSSRLGATTSTIDLSLPEIADDLLDRAEVAVQRVVAEDRPVRVRYPSPEELRAMPLRREPKVQSGVRVIDVKGYDLSPCGGTHCLSTAQVGPVRIVGTERYKGLSRVTFLAGSRAVEDYRLKDGVLRELCRGFSCGPNEVGASIARLRVDLKEGTAALDRVRRDLVGHLVADLLSRHPPDPAGTTRVVVAREGDDPETVRLLAASLARRPDVVALVASRPPDGGGAWKVVVARGEAADFDAGGWLRAATDRHGGRGGGRPDRAEGVLPENVDWEATARHDPCARFT